MTDGPRPDVVADFRASFETLRQYPIVVAPLLIAMVVGFVLKLLFIGAGVSMFAVGGVVGGAAGMAGAVLGGMLLFLVFLVLVMLVNLVASAAVVVMARDAIGGRQPTVGTAVEAVTGRLADVVIASVLFAIIVGVASMFFVLPGIVAAVFLVFTMPAVLLDGLGAVDGIRRSAGLVKDNFGPVLGLVIGGILGLIALWIVALILGFVPLVGPLAVMLAAGLLFAYLTMVAVRLYLRLPRR